MSFASLGLSQALVTAVHNAGYESPTPVQQQAIPAVLKGQDLMVAAQTGTGKTGGFALPVLQKLFADNQEPARKAKQVRVLVLARRRARVRPAAHHAPRACRKDPRRRASHRRCQALLPLGARVPRRVSRARLGL